jgi:hypothetical protein
MTFFNQKEEVIQIELTQYGKHLLSKGKLKPVYYAFFDDDIIYDAKYSGVEETNASAVDRIKEVPRQKVQYVFTGIEEEVEKNLFLIKQNQNNTEMLSSAPHLEKHYSNGQRIGTSFLGDKKIPAINAAILRGEIQQTTTIQTGSSIPNLKVPLLEMKPIEFKISAINANENSQNYNSINVPITFGDGSSIYIQDDYLMIELTEKNVEDQMKNFDIEMFMVENENTEQEKMIPLIFDQKFEVYKDGILLDPPQMSSQDVEYYNTLKEQDPYRAMNYFNILVDQEIEKNLICELINNMRNINSSIYNTNYDCEEYTDNSLQRQQNREQLTSIYDSSFNEDDIKNC